MRSQSTCLESMLGVLSDRRQKHKQSIHRWTWEARLGLRRPYVHRMLACRRRRLFLLAYGVWPTTCSLQFHNEYYFMEVPSMATSVANVIREEVPRLRGFDGLLLDMVARVDFFFVVMQPHRRRPGFTVEVDLWSRGCCYAFGEWHHEADQLLAVMSALLRWVFFYL